MGVAKILEFWRKGGGASGVLQ